MIFSRRRRGNNNLEVARRVRVIFQKAYQPKVLFSLLNQRALNRQHLKLSAHQITVEH